MISFDTIHDMELYGQEPEAALLAAFVPRLDTSAVLDVGAELGAFAEAMLRAGSTSVDLIEPEPVNITCLTERFGHDPRVKIHAVAASDKDGEVALHRSVDRNGNPITFGHTLLDRPDTEAISWSDTISIRARSLGSMVEAGELPSEVAILKVDTEGHDFAVVQGIGELSCDVVMVEHWVLLPDSLGQCPWTADAITSALRNRGFSHFAFVVHHGEFVFMQWDDARVSVGAMGNLVFLHDRVVDRLLPDVLRCSSDLAAGVAELGLTRAEAASARLELIRSLEREKERAARAAGKAAAQQERQAEIAEEQLAEIRKAVRERDEIIDQIGRERDLLAAAAEERLATIEELTREKDLQAEAAEERLVIIERLRSAADPAPPPAIAELRRELDVQRRAAEDRLASLDALTRDHDVRFKELQRSRDAEAKAAEERLVLIKELTQARDAEAEAASERLALIDELARDRDLHAQAAEERLKAIDELRREHTAVVEQLTSERDQQATAAMQRLAALEGIDRDRNLHADQPPQGWR